MSGVKSDETAVWYAALMAAVNFLFTFVGLYLVEKIGRRPLTLASQAGRFLCLVSPFGWANNSHCGWGTPIVSHLYNLEKCPHFVVISLL
jgi:hypothetical protein